MTEAVATGIPGREVEFDTAAVEETADPSNTMPAKKLAGRVESRAKRGFTEFSQVVSWESRPPRSLGAGGAVASGHKSYCKVNNRLMQVNMAKSNNNH
jgi:hypothetical protein